MIVPDWVFIFCGHFIPKTDINICLIADPEIIHSRKKEININELENQQMRILGIFKSKDDYIIRSDFNEEISLNEIKNVIIENVSKKK